jgi:hypothetical protein
MRPDTYIGSTEAQQQQLWVHDGEKLVLSSISFVPGLYKIFDEILVNAADNKVRDPKMDALRVDIDTVRGAFVFLQGAPCILCITETNWMHLVLSGMQKRTLGPYLAAINRIIISHVLHPSSHTLASFWKCAIAAVKNVGHHFVQEGNSIRVYNNGDGVPVEMHKEEKVYVPELIFGHLLTSSNYDDTQKKASSPPLPSLAWQIKFPFSSNQTSSLVLPATGGRSLRTKTQWRDLL